MLEVRTDGENTLFAAEALCAIDVPLSESVPTVTRTSMLPEVAPNAGATVISKP
jgi:hypothetical protein